MEIPDKQLVTFLAKINSNNGTGYYGELFLIDYKDQRFKCYRGNLSDAHLKKIKGKWYFFNFELSNDRLTFRRWQECKTEVYELLRSQHRKSILKKEKESKEEAQLPLSQES